MYYQNKQREIETLLNFNQLKEENEKLKNLRQSLNSREKHINELKESLENQCMQTICLPLPVNSLIPLNNNFINVLPSYIEDLAMYSSYLTSLTVDFISKSIKFQGKELEFINAYFLAICHCTAYYLFEPKHVRVHFRYLANNNTYKKFVASYQGDIFEEPLTPIPSDKGMIYEAGKIKRALIKSLNPDFHIRGSHDDVWVDYITLVFDKLFENGKPFLAMGISVNNADRYKNQLYFLNYSRIENIIQQNLIQFHSKCNILDVVKKSMEEAI